MALLEPDAAEPNTMTSTRHIVAAQHGSVIMEFMLMMPILLLLFGATMLWMDISLGKMYIQEANRNLAWLTEDRYDDGRIKAALYDSAREPYVLRNKVEKSFGGTGDMWKYSGGTTNVWGDFTDSFRNGKQQLWITGKCDWNVMTHGNMDLKMAHLSGVYMGAVAIGSILQPDGETKHLYAAAYDFTRAGPTASTNNTASAVVNTEAIVVHRAYDNGRRSKKEDTREAVTTPNNLLPVLQQAWPTDGTSWEELAEELVGAIGGGGDGGDWNDVDMGWGNVGNADTGGGVGNVDTDDGDSDNDPVKDFFLREYRPAVTMPAVIQVSPAVMKGRGR